MELKKYYLFFLALLIQSIDNITPEPSFFILSEACALIECGIILCLMLIGFGIRVKL